MQAYQITYHGIFHKAKWERFLNYLSNRKIRHICYDEQGLDGCWTNRVVFYMKDDYIHDEPNQKITLDEFRKIMIDKNKGKM